MGLPDLRDFRSALIVKPSSLGDIVHTLPAVHAIKTAHPHLTLRWIAKPEWLPLIEGSPDVDTVVPFPQKTFRGLSGATRMARWVREWNQAERELPEVVLDFQGLLRSGLICLSRGSHPVIGLSDAREGACRFYDHIVPVDAGAHAVDRYLELPRALGIEPASIHFSLPEGQAWQGKLPDRFVLVHPYSRGAGKSLDHACLQALCDQLSALSVVVVGVQRHALPVQGGHVLDLTNQTSLAQLIWLMRRAQAVVSVDSGPMHIAAAVNDATLGIHTWSDPRKVGPYNPAAWVWKAGRLARRDKLSELECLQTQMVTVADIAPIADFTAQLAAA
jgi:heptosyltransferase-1